MRRNATCIPGPSSELLARPLVVYGLLDLQAFFFPSIVAAWEEWANLPDAFWAMNWSEAVGWKEWSAQPSPSPYGGEQVLLRRCPTSEHNKALVRDYIEEAINTGELDRLEEWISPEYVQHNIDSQGQPVMTQQRGAEGYRQSIGAERAAFPDLHIAIDNIVAEGDLVAIHMTFSGTHKGEFRGVSATGKKVYWGSTQFRRIENGIVVEGWGTTDWWRLLRGLVSP